MPSMPRRPIEPNRQVFGSSPEDPIAMDGDEFSEKWNPKPRWSAGQLPSKMRRH